MRRDSWEPKGVGVTSEKRLFDYEVFEAMDRKDRELVDIEARIEHNPDRYLGQLKSGDAVRGTKHFQELRKAVTPVLVSPEFWSKLLDDLYWENSDNEFCDHRPTVETRDLRREI